MATGLLSTLLAMMGFAFATSASPGPVNIVSAMSGAKFGVKKTVSYVLGATIGFVSILALAGAGLAPLITGVPRLKQILALAGSLYMLYLAYKLARASIANLGDYQKAAPPGAMAGIVAQYANPKAWIVAMSAISIYVATSRHYGATLLAFCLIFLAICFPSLLAWSVAGASLTKRLGGIKVFNLVMALLLALSVASFLVEFFRDR